MAAFDRFRPVVGNRPAARLSAAWRRDPGGRLVCRWHRLVPAAVEQPLS